MLTFGAAATIGPGVAAVLPKVAASLALKAPAVTQKTVGNRRKAAQGKKLVGWGLSDTFDYRLPIQSHPLLDLPGAHPDDLAAFRALAEPSLSRAADEGWLSQSDSLSTDYRRNLVLIGSPEVEPLLRLALDYRRRTAAAGFEFVGETVSLPYRWNQDPEETDASSTHVVAGVGWVSRPNWPITRMTAVGPHQLPPAVDHDGRLESDWLLITVMPNFLTLEGLQSRRKIFSIAGTHGVGTRAIGNLLSDSKALRLIDESLTARPEAYQVVIEADKIKHDELRGSYARRIRVHDVVSISMPFDAWKRAQLIVAEHFSDWVAEDNYVNRPLPQDRK